MVGIKKMRAEMSFKMRVVSPSETVRRASYELFCVGSQLWEMYQMLAGGPTVGVAPHLIKFHGLKAKL